MALPWNDIIPSSWLIPRDSDRFSGQGSLSVTGSSMQGYPFVTFGAKHFGYLAGVALTCLVVLRLGLGAWTVRGVDGSSSWRPSVSGGSCWTI
jgi:hypothetical protein